MIELYADRSKRLPAVDADDRELTIGCGAALENLLIAMRYFGYAPGVEIDSHSTQPNLLARVSLERGVEASEEERLLFKAIQKRRTNRHLFTEQRIAVSLLQELEGIGQKQGIFFQAISEELRSAVVNLIVLADRLLWEKPDYHQELGSWISRAQDGSREGIPADALGDEKLASSLDRPVLHTLVRERQRAVQHITPASPALVVISTFADSWFDWLAAGQAIERILLLPASGDNAARSNRFARW